MSNDALEGMNSPRVNFERQFNRREMRGLAIVAKGDMIKKTSKDEYRVKSSDQVTWYKVSWKKEGWSCECKDYAKRGKPCKHIFAILFLCRLPYILMSNLKEFNLECPICKSKDVIRKGFTKSKGFPSQRFMCKACKHKFTEKGETKGLKGNSFALVAVADLYFKGLSLRAIADHMNRIYSLGISYPTLHRWIKRFIKRLQGIEKEHSLKVGEKWHIDETIIKIAGKPHYIWNVLDAETRILLASAITDGRTSEEAEAVIREAISRATSPPSEIITDGLQSYDTALKSDYGSKIKHTSRVKFKDATNNNLIERANGTIKSRMKGFRRLDNYDSSAQLVDGFRLYYNYMRPHQALGGRTPVNQKGVLL